MPLNAKRAMFVREYLIDLNALQAAIRAGYSTATAGQIGCELLKKPDVQQAIQKAMDKRGQNVGVTAERVLKELALIAFSDMREYAKWDGDKLKLTPSGQLSEDATRCVAEVSSSVLRGERVVRFKLYDKVRALENIGRHLGMFKDKVEFTGANGGPIQLTQVREQLDAAVAKLPEDMRNAIGERLMLDAGK